MTTPKKHSCPKDHKTERSLVESLVDILGRFHKDVTQIAQQVSEGKYYHVFYASLDPFNMAFRKLNSYHVEYIDNLEELVIRAKGYIDM